MAGILGEHDENKRITRVMAAVLDVRCDYRGCRALHVALTFPDLSLCTAARSGQSILATDGPIVLHQDI